MSFNPEDFESAENITVPTESVTIPINELGTKTQLKLNSNNQFSKIIAKFKITNEDPVNAITYRTPSPSAPLRRIPPNTSSTIPEYTYYLEINHSITNIDSFVELDLINVKDGKKRDSFVGKGAA